MVRGQLPSKEVVMAVFCHDDLDADGNNLIQSVEAFDKNIATPMRETMEKQAMVEESGDVENYEGFKHFFVNKKTNEVRKFKNIIELVQQQKLDEEDYMNVQNFKRHMSEKLFGTKTRKSEVLSEIGGEENDDEMNKKAKKLMDLIAKRIPSNIVDTIKTPVAKREVIAAFAELIGVPRNGLTSLIGGLKDIAKQGPIDKAEAALDIQPANESVKMTKNELMESLSTKKVIKTVKIKDIK
jgi:hypothetical protein